MIFLFFAFGSSLFMAWTIGADSASPSFGPVVSSRTVGVLRSSLIVGVSAFLGAVLQGRQVTETLSTGFVEGVQFTPVQVTVILLVAASMIAAGIRRHYPIPTAFTLVGATLGVGLGVGGQLEVFQVAKVFSYWLVLPFVAAGIGFAISKLLMNRAHKDSLIVKFIRPLAFFFGIYTA